MTRSASVLVMSGPSGRVLRLLSVLSTRPSWTNRELAERLEVRERTVRRDVARLRDLVYCIELIPPGSGVHEAAGNGTRVTLGGTDVDTLAARCWRWPRRSRCWSRTSSARR